MKRRTLIGAAVFGFIALAVFFSVVGLHRGGVTSGPKENTVSSEPLDVSTCMMLHAADSSLQELLSRPGLKTLTIDGEGVSNNGLGIFSTPDNIAHFAQLEELRLRCPNTSVEGVRHLKDLSSLKVLELDYRAASSKDKPTGSFALGSLTGKSVQRLEMRSYQISSGYLAPLADWTGLVYLELECQDFYDSPEISRISEIKGLKALSVRCKSATGTLLQHVGKLETLEELRISFPLSDPDLAALGSLPKLKFLDLSGSSVSDAGLRHISGIRSLQKVDLRNTKVSRFGIQALKESLGARLVEVIH